MDMLPLKKMRELDLAVDVNAYDFILLNAPKAINNEFYGYAGADVNVSVTRNWHLLT